MPSVPSYLGVKEVAELLGCKPATVRSYLSRTRNDAQPFPAPALVLSNKVGWLEEDILRWQSERPGQGRGERPNRHGNPRSRLRNLRERRIRAGQPAEAALRSWDLGSILGELRAEDVEEAYRRGQIPLKAELHYVHSERSYLLFPYAEVEKWLRAEPHPDVLGDRRGS